MLFSNDRRQLRQVFFDVFSKFQQKKKLDPLEKQILAVILDHPEYHIGLSQPNNNLDQDFSTLHGQNNPFLHLALHLAIQEQIHTNRPAGIQIIYQKLLSKNCGDRLLTEHQMMECLEDVLWLAQKNQQMPDDEMFLKSLRDRFLE